MLETESSNSAAATAAPPAPIRVYSTLSRTKTIFEPVRPGKVGIYLCGPTVYKPSHIGHMVGPVIFDAIKRYLTYSGYEVTLVVNITDVDDKLISEANRRGMSMKAVADEMTADYQKNLAAMGIDTIDHFPKATDHIEGIIEFIGRLIERGFAYASEGDVYFDVARDREYGKLSGRGVDSMQGEGGSTAERKRSTADFALWKKAKPGEPAWNSPWGEGRPGWHIECSVMSYKLLGETFDMHGGGLDLVFPHHENEVAQSECCHGKPQAKYWMHNGLMQASSEIGKLGGRNTAAKPNDAAAAVGDQAAQEAGKMGKSKGASAFRDLLVQFHGETIRFFLLNSHYRSPIDYSEERIREIEKSMEAFYRFFDRHKRVTGDSFHSIEPAARREAGDFEPGYPAVRKQIHELRRQFQEAMDDDFNTGASIGVLFELVRLLNKFADQEKLEAGVKDVNLLESFRLGSRVLRELSATLGLFQKPIAAPTSAGDGDTIVSDLMTLLIDVRAEARKQKNFALADLVRNRLTELKITLEDRASGTEWKRGK